MAFDGQMKVEIVSKALACQLGEGPHWHPDEGVLYYVDLFIGRVLRYDPKDGGNCSYVDVSTSTINHLWIYVQHYG